MFIANTVAKHRAEILMTSNSWETFVPTFPDTGHHPECNLCTGPVMVCSAIVVQPHHAAIVQLETIGLIAHGPFNTVRCLLK